MSFALHPRLAADTAWIAEWPLSRVLLMNDSRYPWIVLVPRRADATELFQLDEAARTTLMGEIARAGQGLNAWASTHGGCDKINVGAIGNLVPQLHIHVVARRIGDAAWPQPVWGKGEPMPYSAGDLTRLTAALAAAL